LKFQEYKELIEALEIDRKEIEKKWKQSQEFYYGEQWGFIESSKPLRKINLIKKYVDNTTQAILDHRPSIRLISYDTELLDEVKLINRWIERQYSNHIYNSLELSIFDGILFNYGVLKFLIKDGKLKTKRINPFSIYRTSGKEVIEKIGDAHYKFWSNDEIVEIDLKDEKLKKEGNKNKVIPFCILDFEPIDKEKNLYGYPLIDDLIPLQKEINKLRTDLSFNIAMTVNPPLLISNYADVEDWELDELTPGQAIRVNDMNSVRPLFSAERQIATQHILAQINEIKREFIELTGISELTLGHTSRSLSGSAIAQLQESANSQIRKKQRKLEYFLKDLSYKLISICKNSIKEIDIYDNDEKTKYKINFENLKDYEIETHAVSHSSLTPQQRFTILHQFGEILDGETKRAILMSMINDIVPESSEKISEKIEHQQNQAEAQNMMAMMAQQAGIPIPSGEGGEVGDDTQEMEEME
jgi:hypothetical protein